MTEALREQVREAARQAMLREVQRSARSAPAPNSPVALTVVREESERLPEFLAHHRQLGVERFVFVCDESDDGTIARLRGEVDVDLFQTAAPFSTVAKQGWLNALVASIGYDRWHLVLEADEKLVFDGSEARDIRQLVKLAEGAGLRRVRGFLLDTYPSGALLRPDEEGGAPLFDGAGYRERPGPGMPSVLGGGRARVFGALYPEFQPELTRFPLFRLKPDELLESPHAIWPYADNFRSPRLVALLHDEFSGRFSERLTDALRGDADPDERFEHRCYENALRRNSSLQLSGRSSYAYLGTAQLTAMGLIVAPDWQAGLLSRGEAAHGQGGASRPGGKDGFGWVTLNQALELETGYAHLDIGVSRIQSGGAVWPALRFKLARFEGRPKLEFRNTPDWPEFFHPWPGQEEDSFGRLFTLTQERLPLAALEFAGSQPGLVLAALLRFLPEIVDVALRQAREGLAESEWLAAGTALSGAWASGEAETPGLRPRREPTFESVRLNQHLALDSRYSHVDISVSQLQTQDRVWPSLRFKLARFNDASSLEFRQGPGWPQMFDPWFGNQRDQHGEFFQLSEAALPLVAVASLGAQAGFVFDALFAVMPRVVAVALQQAGSADPAQGEWIAAAERLCAAWSRGLREALAKPRTGPIAPAPAAAG